MIPLLLTLAVLSQVSVDDEAAQIRRYLTTIGTELTSSDLDKLEAVSKEIQATVDRSSKEKQINAKTNRTRRTVPTSKSNPAVRGKQESKRRRVGKGVGHFHRDNKSLYGRQFNA